MRLEVRIQAFDDEAKTLIAEVGTEIQREGLGWKKCGLCLFKKTPA